MSEGVLDDATHLLGGAFGKGLDYKIVKAFEFIALNYDPGDRIFIFGFSRGAYTARCLAGLLRWLGVLRRSEASHAAEAMALYRQRPAKPGDASTQAAESAAFAALVAPFRQAHSHPSGEFTASKRYVPGDPGSLAPQGEGCSWLQYVGVWETVGSLGVPANLLFATQVNAQYRFYDPSLSWFVRSARHAVAIDERRKTFAPTLWDNIDALNLNAQADGLAYGLRPYQQSWFPGGHGSVGGGEADGGLSLAALLWIAEGAARAGFAFDPSQLAGFEQNARPCAPFPKGGFSVGGLLLDLDGLQDRVGPSTLDEVSLTTRLRLRDTPDWRPQPLAAVAATAAQAPFPPPPVRLYDPGGAAGSA